MIEVYHRNKPTFSGDVQRALKAWPEEFTKVAEVATDDLETAFRLTNSVDHYWAKNLGVKVTAADSARPHRSTSVGDVVKKGDDYFIVATAGFDTLPVPTVTIVAAAGRDSGMSSQAEWRLFLEMLADPTDWKNPIDKTVTFTEQPGRPFDLEQKKRMVAAIIWNYTATEAKITVTGPCSLHVKAAGYYAGPAAGGHS